MIRFLLLCLLSMPALAENDLEALVGEGVFGVKWTATMDQVRQVLPNGKVKDYGGLTSYIVRDQRSVFEVERGSKDTLSFGFVDDILRGITVSFPDCAALQAKLHKFFGEPDARDTQTRAVIDFGTWKGDTVSMRMYVSIPNDCLLTIEKDQGTVDATADSLGLN